MATRASTKRIFDTRRLPDDDPWFIVPVVEDWYREYVAQGLTEKAFALPGSKVRASWAGDCAHAVALHVAGVEPTDPPTVADAWRFNIGTLVHEQVQAAIEKAFPGSRSEVKVRIGEHGSGHMDLWVVKPDGETWSVEIKTINGTGFRRSTSRRDPEGVRIKYAMQGALNAYSHDPQPDHLLIAVFSLETMSTKEADKNLLPDEYSRFAAQYTFTRDEYTTLALDEIARLERIVTVTEERGSDYVPRLIPDPFLPHHKVRDPRKGLLSVLDDNDREIGIGHTWHCGYCPFQSHCCEEMGIRP